MLCAGSGFVNMKETLVKFAFLSTSTCILILGLNSLSFFFLCFLNNWIKGFIYKLMLSASSGFVNMKETLNS